MYQIIKIIQTDKLILTLLVLFLLLTNTYYGEGQINSSAIMLAMEALNLPEGSEVITPALTFSTTVSYIVKNKLIPVFADVEEGTYCINENKIKNLITKKTKAILAPH